MHYEIQWNVYTRLDAPLVILSNVKLL